MQRRKRRRWSRGPLKYARSLRCARHRSLRRPPGTTLRSASRALTSRDLNSLSKHRDFNTLPGAFGIQPTDRNTRVAIKRLIFHSLLFVTSVAAHAQTAHEAAGKAALIVGPTFALTVRAPQGWTLDSRAGKRQGLQAVLYPNGSSWEGSSTVMYLQVLGRDETHDRRAVIDADVENYRNGAPSALVSEQPEIVVTKGNPALVYRYAGGARGTVEETAYLDERTVVVLIVLSSRDTTTFRKSLDSFRDLVSSYSFLADDAENIQRAIEAVEP